MRGFFRWTFELVAMAGVVAAGACGGGNEKQPASDEVRAVTGLPSSGQGLCTVRMEGYYYVGIISDFSGSVSFVGAEVERATVQALGEINAAGGIKGRKLGYLACDSAWNITQAALAVSELGAASPVLAAMGHVSGDNTPVAVAAQEAGLPMFWKAPFANTEFAFGTSPEEQVNAKANYRRFMADGITHVVDITLPSFLALRPEPGRTWFEAQGGYVTRLIVGWPAVGLPGPTTSETIAAAEAAGPEAVFLDDMPPEVAAPLVVAGKLNTALKDLPWYYDAWTATPAWVTTVGNNALLEGMRGLHIGGHATARHAFDSRYRELWGVAASRSHFAYYAYDEVMLAALAMQLAEDTDDRTQVRDQVYNTHSGTVVKVGAWADAIAHSAEGELDYDGLTGPVDLDDTDRNNVHVVYFYATEIDANGNFIEQTDECYSSDAEQIACD